MPPKQQTLRSTRAPRSTAVERIDRADTPQLEPAAIVRAQAGSDISAAAVAEVRGRERFYERKGKRILDLALLSFALPFACAVALPIAAWNLVAFRDVRQVLFLQQRVGHRGRVFRIYKFRTMRSVTPSELGDWSLEKDVQRTTRFGRFLRNTHLDELPQLLNILKGDMHLVGPRPEMVEVHEWACGVIPGFAQRLETAPGLTGLAQVTQGYTVREAECYAQKLDIDLSYVRNSTLRQDLAIIARTIPWVLQGRGWSWLAHQRGRGATTPDRESSSGAEPSRAPGS